MNFVSMKMHIGEKIKARAKELRVGPTELAKKISTSKQNVYGIYKRESIDTDLLEKISKALQFDFFTLYINAKLFPHTDPGYKKGKNYPAHEEEFGHLKVQLADLQEKYELLKKVNLLLEEKKGK
jgi:hypothetical protein